MNQSYFDLMHERPALFLNDLSNSSIRIENDIDSIVQFERANNVEIGILYQDQYVLLIKDLVTHPNGKIGTYIRVVSSSKNSGVVILPILDNTILFLKHFRHSTRSAHYELPRGFGSDALSEEANAAKELLEETGYSIRTLRMLGRVYPDTGLLATQAIVYCAIVDAEAQLATDIEEAVDAVERIDMNTVKKMVANGEITDGYSLSALALYWVRESVE